MVAIIPTLVIMTINSFFQTFHGLPIEGFESRHRLWEKLLWMMDWGPYWMTFSATVLTIVSGIIYIKNNFDLFREQI